MMSELLFFRGEDSGGDGYVGLDVEGKGILDKDGQEGKNIVIRECFFHIFLLLFIYQPQSC